MKKYQSFLSENFQFLMVKFSIYLNKSVFVMCLHLGQVWLGGKLSEHLGYIQFDYESHQRKGPLSR